MKVSVVGCPSLRFSCDSSTTVGALKQQLQVILCVAASRLRIFSEGNQLCDDSEHLCGEERSAVSCAVFLPPWAKVMVEGENKKRHRSSSDGTGHFSLYLLLPSSPLYGLKLDFDVSYARATIGDIRKKINEICFLPQNELRLESGKLLSDNRAYLRSLSIEPMSSLVFSSPSAPRLPLQPLLFFSATNGVEDELVEQGFARQFKRAMYAANTGSNRVRVSLSDGRNQIEMPKNPAEPISK